MGVPHQWLTKLEGGLGVKQISVQNACLLLKLLHRLHHPAGSSWATWARQRINLHTLHGDVEGAHWDALRSLLPAYRQLTFVSVRDGATTAFWEDTWTGGQPLCTSFPALYSHVARHGASVQETASLGLTHFLVPRLTREAAEELAIVRDIVSSWIPQQGGDERECYLQAENKSLITRKIYRLAVSTGSPCAYFSFVWKNHAPAKVKFFAWLIQNRIQCSVNLKRKNILDSDTCEVCKRLPESADHLISGCTFSQSFWRHIGWDPAAIPPVSQLWELQTQGGAPARSLPTMFLLCCWQLWNHRHNVVFRSKSPNLRHLLLECRAAAKLWRWRLPALQRGDSDYWSSLFVM